MMPHFVRRGCRPSLVGAMLIGVAACHDDPAGLPNDTEICGLGAGPAMQVTVRDSLAGAYTATNATFTASIGLVVESRTRLPGPGSDSLPMLLGDQPGTYRLEVGKSGYRTWRRDGVVVPVDPRFKCNYSLRQFITVLLVPAG